ncbi:copper amine oxidase [Russula vinacea]|nr:copper amine oxidase [Russula vinacea]
MSVQPTESQAPSRSLYDRRSIPGRAPSPCRSHLRQSHSIYHELSSSPPKRAVLAHLGIPLTTGETVKDEDRVPIVQALAKEVGIEPHQIFADGWSIGYDDRFPTSLRLQQALLFARFSQHENLYAHPLDFIPVVDANAGKVVHIDFPGAYPNVPASTQPPHLIEDDARRDGKEWKQREAPKPLHIVQPEGVSFKIDGHVLEWQKWKMHIGTPSLSPKTCIG